METQNLERAKWHALAEAYIQPLPSGAWQWLRGLFTSHPVNKKVFKSTVWYKISWFVNGTFQKLKLNHGTTLVWCVGKWYCARAWYERGVPPAAGPLPGTLQAPLPGSSLLNIFSRTAPSAATHHISASFVCIVCVSLLTVLRV